MKIIYQNLDFKMRPLFPGMGLTYLIVLILIHFGTIFIW